MVVLRDLVTRGQLLLPHRGVHLAVQLLVLRFLRANRGHDRTLGLGINNMAEYFMCLSETPESSEDLEERFKGITQQDRRIPAALEVHSPAANSWLAEKPFDVACSERGQFVLFRVCHVSPANFDNLRNRGTDGSRLIVCIAPHEPLLARQRINQLRYLCRSRVLRQPQLFMQAHRSHVWVAEQLRL